MASIKETADKKKKKSVIKKPSADKKKSSAFKKKIIKKTAAAESTGKITDGKDLQAADNKVIQETDDLDPKALARGDSPMSIVGHLDELRSRFIFTLITVLVVTLISFFISEYLLNILNRPYLATGLKLNVFNLTEGFMLRLKASLIMGVLVGLPVIVYEIWKYIYPAIESGDRKFIAKSLIAAIFLFYGGLAFTYFLILPVGVQMFISFTPPEMTNTINATEYLRFILLCGLGMGLIFEMPIIIMILTKMGIVTPQFLITKRKYAIVLIWVIAAIITPSPDVLSQIIVGIPMMILYEISIIISKLIMIRKKKKELANS